MLGCLAEKRCLIVGGTSGLGLSAAEGFLEAGARVVVAGRSLQKGGEAIARLRDKGSVSFIPCQAADPAQVGRLLNEAVAFLEGLDVLYHVAGRSGRQEGDGSLHECTNEGWQATIDDNLKSTFLTNRAVVRYFLSEKQPG